MSSETSLHKSKNVVEDLAKRLEETYGNVNSKLVTIIAKLDWLIETVEPHENPMGEDDAS